VHDQFLAQAPRPPDLQTLDPKPLKQILTDYDMINFLHKHLAPGASEDDIVLEIVIFIGTCIQDPKCAPIFATSNLVNSLYDLMADKQEDDEIVLQITYTLYRCLQHESTRVILLEQTQVVSYFVDLLYDKNGEIRRMADQTLDLVMEFDQVKIVPPQLFSLGVADFVTSTSHNLGASCATGHDLF
jgi:hypothetical protein